MRDIGGFVWIVFVVIAVISSIVRSARRASVQRTQTTPVPRPAPQQAAPQPRPVPQAAPTTTVFAPQRRIKVNVKAGPGVQIPPQLATLVQQFERDAQSAVVRPAPVVAPPSAVVPVSAPAPSPTAPSSPPALREPSPPATAPTGLFADRGALIRGIIAAEVLGKPLALRDE